MPGKSYACISTVDCAALNLTLMSLIGHAQIPSADARHLVLLRQLNLDIQTSQHLKAVFNCT